MSPALPALVTAAARGQVKDAPAVLTAWEEAVGSAATRTAALLAAPAVSRGLRRAGALDEALAVCRQAQPLVTGPEVLATLGQARLVAELASGTQVAAQDLLAAAAALVAASDGRFDKGQHEEASRLLYLAWELLLDRSLHAESTRSPLTDDPDSWLAQVSAAKVARWFAAARPDRPRRWPRRRVRRVLVVTKDGSHFLDQPRQVAARAGIEVREVVLRSLSGKGWQMPAGIALAQLRVAARRGERPEVPAELAEAYAWADQVLVDWCDDAAAVVAATAPPGTEVAVRLHSIEALSVQPHFVAWERVSRLVFVAEHVQRLVEQVVPAVRGVRRGIVPPHEPRLSGGSVPPAGPDRVLALVGWSQPVKDPVWALEVLAELRRHDPGWRLLLVGPDQFALGSTRPLVNAYAERFAARLAEPDVAGAVDRLPWLEDVTTLGAHACAILSSSVREGYAVALHEAVEGGLLPVVRRWPLLGRYDPPGGTCAGEWVVDTPQQAAARLLGADPAARERAWQWLHAHLGREAVGQRYRTHLGWPVPHRR